MSSLIHGTPSLYHEYFFTFFTLKLCPTTFCKMFVKLQISTKNNILQHLQFLCIIFTAYGENLKGNCSSILYFTEFMWNLSPISR